MTVIYVLSIKGNLLGVVHRKRFKKSEGFDMKVPYKGKWYNVYDRRKTNIDGYAIYPYGVQKRVMK